MRGKDWERYVGEVRRGYEVQVGELRGQLEEMRWLRDKLMTAMRLIGEREQMEAPTESFPDRETVSGMGGSDGTVDISDMFKEEDVGAFS